MPRQMVKDPDAELNYQIDWSQWLAAGETLVASSWTVPATLVALSDSFTATLTTVWLKGGSAGSTYTVTNHITTSAGRKDDRSITLDVRER